MCKRKLNIRQILKAFISKPGSVGKDIHTQLAETIAERKRILKQWEQLFLPKPAVLKKDVHEQLQQTIAELKRERQLWVTAKNAA